MSDHEIRDAFRLILQTLETNMEAIQLLMRRVQDLENKEKADAYLK